MRRKSAKDYGVNSSNVDNVEDTRVEYKNLY